MDAVWAVVTVLLFIWAVETTRWSDEDETLFIEEQKRKWL